MTQVRLTVPLIICFLSVAANPAFAQNASKIEKTESSRVYSDEELQLIKSNGKIRTIPIQKTIKVWLKNSEVVLKGKYQILSDSTIAIDDQVINLADIEKLSGFTWPSLFSPILIAGGGTGLGFGLVIAYLGAHYAYAGMGVGIFLGGAALIMVGGAAVALGAVIWYYSKTFKIGEKWRIINSQGKIISQISASPKSPFAAIF